MKRTYVRPTMVGERFVANEYVAACGDTEYGKYKFICDAGGGKKGDVYEEVLISNFLPCYNALVVRSCLCIRFRLIKLCFVEFVRCRSVTVRNVNGFFWI